MRHFILIALGTTALIGLGGSQVSAADTGFTSHYSVASQPYREYAESLSASEKLKLREYLDYEEREPCQNYQAVPEGFVKDGCHLARVSGQDAVQNTESEQTVAPQQAPEQSRDFSHVLADYTVNFAFDSSALEPAANTTLDQVAKEIKTYNPSEVIVAGHTDKAGSTAYNVALSRKRADAVSQALTGRGVANRVLDEKAYGESMPAVDTKDGVPLRENRRTVIEFRK